MASIAVLTSNRTLAEARHHADKAKRDPEEMSRLVTLEDVKGKLYYISRLIIRIIIPTAIAVSHISTSLLKKMAKHTAIVFDEFYR